MAGQLLFVSSLLCSLSSLVQAQTSWTVGQAVDTTSGTLTGTHAVNNSDVSLYAGIPYAQAPIGDLRWASPRAYANTSSYNATVFSPGCSANSLANGDAAQAVAQQLANLAGASAINNLLSIGGIGGTQSEDCLYLNVWTKPQTGEDKKAVLIWFYGGGFQFGTSNSKTYNGEYFVEDEDVVVVSVNYRTNVFGFPGLPGTSSAAQNPGLEDQRLAIEWVRDNIAAFHGDPERITLFGESAGAASIDFYNYAYVDDPIIAGSICESGTARGFFDPVKMNNTASWYNMSQALGCGDNSTSPDDSLACLRTKSTAEVLNVTQIADPLLAILGNFQPNVDEKVVFSDYPTRGKNGNFIRKPYFTGNNNYEAGIFKFLATSVHPPISEKSWDIFNLLVFTCPAMDAANVRYEAGSPVWRYRYFGEFPNERLTIAPNSGAYHASEIGIVFETSEDSSGAANTANETIISAYMNKLWADFAKDPDTAFSSRDLPAWNPNEKSLIYFGVKNETEPWVVYANNTDESCGPIVQTIGLLGGTNALLGDPQGFNAQYGSLSDGLNGFVGIGDSNHPDAPFGPPPIASLTPTSTPTLSLNSTTIVPSATGTGTAVTGTGTGPLTTVNGTRPTVTGTAVTGTGTTISGTGVVTLSTVTSPLSTVTGTVTSGTVIIPTTTVTPVSSTLVSPLPPLSFGGTTVISRSSAPIGSGTGTFVTSVRPSGTAPTGSGTAPIGTGTGVSTSRPIGTGTGTGVSSPRPSGTGAGTGVSSPRPSGTGAGTGVSSKPAGTGTGAGTGASSKPTGTGTAPGTAVPSKSTGTKTATPSLPTPGLGGYGTLPPLNPELEKKLQEAKEMFEKLYKEGKRKRSVAAWAARPDKLLERVIDDA